jgi:hypothetical protein
MRVENFSYHESNNKSLREKVKASYESRAH